MFRRRPRHPTENLRLYAAQAEIPPLPSNPAQKIAPLDPRPGHRSYRNLLKTCSETYRHLSVALKLNAAFFKESVRKFQPHLPARPLTPANQLDEDYFWTPASGFTTTPHHSQTRGSYNIGKIVTLVEVNVLRTAVSIVHHAFPETAIWAICPSELDQDSNLLQTLEWRSNDIGDAAAGEEDIVTPLITFVQPSWILSRRDFELVIAAGQRTSKMQSETSHPAGKLKSSQRVWSKIWDTCTEKNCRWFVLTNYEQWAFGVFSPGWTTGFISGIIDRSAADPNVLQTLCYWMMSSIRPEIGFQVPELSEEATKSIELIHHDLEFLGATVYFKEQIDSGSEEEEVNEIVQQAQMNQASGRSNESNQGAVNEGLEHLRLVNKLDLVNKWKAGPLVPQKAPRHQQDPQRAPLATVVYRDAEETEKESENEVAESEWTSKADLLLRPTGQLLFHRPVENMTREELFETQSSQNVTDGLLVTKERPRPPSNTQLMSYARLGTEW